MAALVNNINNPVSVPMSGVTLPLQCFRIGSTDYIKAAAGYDALNLTTGAVEAISPSTEVVLIDAEISEV